MDRATVLPPDRVGAVWADASDAAEPGAAGAETFMKTKMILAVQREREQVPSIRPERP